MPAASATQVRTTAIIAQRTSAAIAYPAMMPPRCGAETSRRRAKPRSKSRGDPEACKHAAERSRLQKHEDELERGVAAVEVEARHMAKTGESAGERHEVHQREEHRRNEQRRVLEQHRHLPVRERERDVERTLHVRAILTFN